MKLIRFSLIDVGTNHMRAKLTAIIGEGGFMAPSDYSHLRGMIISKKRILVREKSVKSQRISLQIKSGHPE